MSLCFVTAEAQNLERIYLLNADTLGIGQQFVIDDFRDQAIIGVNSDLYDSNNSYSFSKTILLFKPLNNNLPAQSVTLDTNNYLLLTRMLLLDDKLYVLGFSNSPSSTPTTTPILLYRVDVNTRSIDTLLFSYPNKPIIALNLYCNNDFVFIGANLHDPSQHQPQRSTLKVTKINRNNLTTSDSTIIISAGRLSPIFISEIFQFDTQHIYTVCGGCKTFPSTISPIFNNYNISFPGIRKYDFNFNIIQDEIFDPKKHPNFPFEFDSIEYGPTEIRGLVKIHANRYVQFAGYHNLNNPNTLNLPGMQVQDLFLTNFDSMFNQGTMVKFGIPDIPDIPTNAVYAGNNKLYTCAATNATAHIFFPDSLSSVLINIFDTSMVMAHQIVWNDGTDVAPVGLQSAASGVYILANTLHRGPTRTHLLRISNSSFPTSLPAHSSPKIWKLYPIPTQNTIQITSDQPIRSAEIFDLHGRKLHSEIIEAEPSIQITVLNLQSGMYLMKLNFLDGSTSDFKKFVKIE